MRIFHKNHMAIHLSMVLLALSYAESYAQSPPVIEHPRGSISKPTKERNFLSHSTGEGILRSDGSQIAPLQHEFLSFTVKNVESNGSISTHKSRDSPTSGGENQKLDTQSAAGSQAILSFIPSFSNIQSPEVSQGSTWQFVQGQGPSYIHTPVNSRDRTNNVRVGGLREIQVNKENSFGENSKDLYINSPRKITPEIVYNPYTRLDDSKQSPHDHDKAKIISKSPSFVDQKNFHDSFSNNPNFPQSNPQNHQSLPDFHIQRGHLRHYEQKQFPDYYNNQENQTEYIDNPVAYDYSDHSEFYDYSIDENGDIREYVSPDIYISDDDSSPTTSQSITSKEEDKKRQEEYASSLNISQSLPKEKEEVKSIEPKNLASLLAKSEIVDFNTHSASDSNSSLANIEHSQQTKLENTTGTVQFSKSRSMVPEHIKFFKDKNPEEYDYLYDEFLNMYYYDNDDEAVTETTTTKESVIPQKEIKYKSSTKPISPVIPTELPYLNKETSAAPAIETTSKSTTTSTSSNDSKIEVKSSDPVPVVPTVISTPLSLSEILQELGLSLPQFLGTLKTHGTSLKEFTSKLEKNSISKSVFRRTKGSVKKLLEVLDGNSANSLRDKTNISTTQKTLPKQKKLTTQRTPVYSSSTSFLPITQSVTTAQPIKTTKKSPVVFGSQPSGIDFLKPNEKQLSVKVELSDPPTKLNVTSINPAKDIHSTEILQTFSEMFNISSIEEIEANPKSSSTTESTATKLRDATAQLRPYRKGAERLRPYRPYDDSKGNPKIHRGVINSRLSSTARPTLRPPYIPRYNEHEENQLTPVEISPNRSPIQTTKSVSYNNEKKRKPFKNSKENSDYKQVSAKSAIMAAAILGGVALSVFIAIFIVVKYRSHIRRHKRRVPLAIPSDSSTSSIPPIYGNRPVYSRECYQTSGFWTSLKKKFDPYSPSSSPMYM